MENHEFGSVIGSGTAPFVDDLAGRSVLLTSSYAITHPSLPNYLALVGGSTFGIESDCTSCTVDGRGLVDQLDSAGIGWRAYMEGMPSPCFTGAASGRYAKKHDPFLYFEDLVGDPARCRRVTPFTELEADLAANRLPAFAWITPDLCHDMHDCSVQEGDAWLRTWVPRVVGGLGPEGILILTFDEGSTEARCCGVAAGGHIVTIITGPGARAGIEQRLPADHYSILRLIEDNWGLPRLGQAACPCTPTIVGWRR
jgi:hypothetical protein